MLDSNSEGNLADLALYRKYRSQHFDEVVGQAHIVATLKNALTSGQLSHAYLFTGPRGVGKTSIARLLAQSLNCQASQTSDRKPCGQCELCLLPLSSNLDIYEIDAASNRRIDEIRELRDKIGLAPNIGRYKIYIIDEVHMLTTEAFNALLKTLEEPPPHAVFILATTEAHKLPETIVSRTQRFNFKPIGIPDLEAHLSSIAAREKINIEPDALGTLAAASKGSFRDAISLLDQVSSSGIAPIQDSTVRHILGWSNSETIDHISLAIAESNPAQVLSALDQSLEQGAQITQIATQLIDRWRGLMLGVVNRNSGSDPIKEVVESRLSLSQIVEIVDSLVSASESAWPQISLESTLVKLTTNQTRTGVLEHSEPTPTQGPAKTATPTAQPETFSSELWPKTLLIIKEQNNSLYALLRSCSVAISENEVVVTCRFKFHRERLQESKNRQIIEASLKKVYGAELRVVCQLEEAKTANIPAPETELITSALEIFGGEVVDEQ